MLTPPLRGNIRGSWCTSLSVAQPRQGACVPCSPLGTHVGRALAGASTPTWVITELAPLGPEVLRNFRIPVGDGEMRWTNWRTICRA